VKTPGRSHGLRNIAATASPRVLMDESGAKSDPVWRARVLTLFPEMFPGPLGVSLTGKALEKRLWTLESLDIRSFARDKHRSVDDTPAGGGPGMVLRPEIVAQAIDASLKGVPDDRDLWPVICLSARGRPLTQKRVARLAAGQGVSLLCGRFEGIDQRALEARDVEEISVGDAVYTGGEIPAMALLDAVVRLLPGVLGKIESTEDESFSAGLLEHPQYTKPPVWEGRAIPEVLLSGHHAKVAAWRRTQAETVTKERRPDLWRAFRNLAEPYPTEEPEQSDAKHESQMRPEEGSTT
jgi:tRNA (guanine37-N1)-methyltransferase